MKTLYKSDVSKVREIKDNHKILVKLEYVTNLSRKISSQQSDEKEDY